MRARPTMSHWVTGALLAAAPAHAATPETPGPSRHLFDHPYYACLANTYVSTTGNDSNDGQTQATAWATLQHANDAAPAAGACINVAPGTYNQGVLINHGGSAAAPAGYVVYRCATLDGCTLTGAAQYQAGTFTWDFSTQPMPGSYVIVDGFTMRSADQANIYGQGIELWDGSDYLPNSPSSVHHVWLINNIISNYGQSGIQMNDGEYLYAIHNTVYGNAYTGCSAQGSGISYVTLKAFTNYTRVTADSTTPLLTAPLGAFNNAVMWNVLYNNATTQCGTKKNPYDTDGNDIIMDTFNNGNQQGGNPTGPVYEGSTLVAFNVTYNAGGRGIHLFLSENITVANNTCYHSALDPYDNGTYRPCIGENDSTNSTFFNNIAASIAGKGYNAYDDAFVGGLYPGGAPDGFTNNMSFCAGNPLYGCTPMYNGDSFSCTANQCNVDPQWVDAGTQSAGTETRQPRGANFALRSGSPAIGAGITASYLPPQSVDLGACAHDLAICPEKAARP